MQLNNRNKGFSLIELLVAIAVMSIIMVMVVQMMGNSSVILRKTNKKLELQTEALEFREQFSDIVMQATYIRVETADKKTYTLDTGIDSSAKNKRKRIATSVGDINGTLVSDNYPNYKLAGSNNYDIYMKSADYTLYCIDNTKTVHNSDSYQSFRKLLDGVSSGNPYYVKPSYIYIRYHIDNSANTENYAIFRFVDNSGSYSVFADKGTITNTNTATDDGFNAAKTAVLMLSPGIPVLCLRMLKMCIFQLMLLAILHLWICSSKMQNILIRHTNTEILYHCVIHMLLQ